MRGVPAIVAGGACTLLLLAAFAFWPQYLSSARTATDPFSHVHAALGTAWLLLLTAQALLIRAGERATHRAVGRIAYVLGPAFIVSSVLLAHYRFARMPAVAYAEAAHSLYLPLSQATLFAVALAMALWRTSPTPIHARFMAATAVFFLDPLLGRILFFYFPPLPSPLWYQAITFSVIVFVLATLYLSIGAGLRGRKSFAVFLGFSALTLLLYFSVAQGPGWRAFGDWFRNLPMTA